VRLLRLQCLPSFDLPCLNQRRNRGRGRGRGRGHGRSRGRRRGRRHGRGRACAAAQSPGQAESDQHLYYIRQYGKLAVDIKRQVGNLQAYTRSSQVQLHDRQGASHQHRAPTRGRSAAASCGRSGRDRGRGRGRGHSRGRGRACTT